MLMDVGIVLFFILICTGKCEFVIIILRGKHIGT